MAKETKKYKYTKYQQKVTYSKEKLTNIAKTGKLNLFPVRKVRGKDEYYRVNKGSYKNEDAWLNAIYRQNKEIIDQAVSETPRGDAKPRAAFKDLYKEYREQGNTPTQAIRKLSNDPRFLTAERQQYINFVKGLKEFDMGSSEDGGKRRTGWDVVQQHLRGEKGRYEKITKLEELKGERYSTFLVNGYLKIIWDISPKGFSIVDTRTGMRTEYFVDEYTGEYSKDSFNINSPAQGSRLWKDLNNDR